LSILAGTDASTSAAVGFCREHLAECCREALASLQAGAVEQEVGKLADLRRLCAGLSTGGDLDENVHDVLFVCLLLHAHETLSADRGVDGPARAPMQLPPNSKPAGFCQPRAIEIDRCREYERCIRCGQSWPKGDPSFCEAAREHLANVTQTMQSEVAIDNSAPHARAIHEWDALPPAIAGALAPASILPSGSTPGPAHNVAGTEPWLLESVRKAVDLPPDATPPEYMIRLASAIATATAAHLRGEVAVIPAHGDASVRYGCYCDLGPGEEPDGCVIDTGKRDDCVHARHPATKEKCEHWLPIAVSRKLPNAADIPCDGS
jgi:hypothetical protein